jgi:hypothetical protein
MTQAASAEFISARAAGGERVCARGGAVVVYYPPDFANNAGKAGATGAASK